MHPGLKFHIERAWARNRYAFYMLARAFDGDEFSVGAIARPVVMEALPPSEAALARSDEATFYLRDEEIQALIDQLWTLGFRPSEGTGSAGALKQAEDHLATLKKVAFKLVDHVADRTPVIVNGDRVLS